MWTLPSKTTCYCATLCCLRDTNFLPKKLILRSSFTAMDSCSIVMKSTRSRKCVCRNIELLSCCAAGTNGCPHQAGSLLSAVEWTRAKVALRNIVVPAPQSEAASHLKSATRDVSLLRRDSKCWWYVSFLSNVSPRYLGSEQKGRISFLKLAFSSSLAALLLTWKIAETVFAVLSFNFQVLRYLPIVVLCLLSIPSTAYPISMNNCWIIGLWILSGDDDCQVSGVEVEKKGCQDGSMQNVRFEVS